MIRFVKTFVSIPVLITLLFGVLTVSAQNEAETNIAKDITKTAKFELDNGGSVASITDSNNSTNLKHKGKLEITISSDEEIASIYLITNRPIGKWTITIDNKAQTYGENDFIHEYVKLEKQAKTIKLNLDSTDISICDIYLFAKGEQPPEWVQVWEKPYDKADMLLVSTHADDEHLWFGGALPTYAGERGLKVQVAYLVNHWGEWYRPHEMLNGLWKVGVKAYPVIGKYNDKLVSDIEHAERIYNREEWLKTQVELIRRFKPEVVLAQDLKGEYGHGAHILGAECVKEAIDISNNPRVYPESAQKYGAWDVKKVYFHLYGENQLVMDWDKPLSKFDNKTGFEMAKEGFDCHKSQVKYFSVEKSGKYDCRKFGLFRSLVGPDVEKNDFFENIDLTAPPPPSSSQPVSDESSDVVSDNSSTADDPNDDIVNPSLVWVYITMFALLGLGLLTAIGILAFKLRNKKKK